ncbi:MAG: ankyrin repeat domain-containing protein [Alphaproteobacteria bacterium]
MMTTGRYVVVSADCAEAIGLDDLVRAEKAALAAGEGAYLVDTRGVPYRPSLQRVEGGILVYSGLGHIDHRQGLDASLVEGVRRGSAPMVRAFLARGASADARDAHGGPALVWAVAAGEAAVVRMLIAAGADVNQADAGGITPLALAVRQDRSDIADLLRRAGAIR